MRSLRPVYPQRNVTSRPGDAPSAPHDSVPCRTGETRPGSFRPFRMPVLWRRMSFIRRWVRITARGLVAACGLSLSPAAALGQAAQDSTCRVYLQGSDFVGPTADLARLIHLSDTASHASFSIQRAARVHSGDACPAPASITRLARLLGAPPPDDGVRLFAPELLVVGNSAYPRDWNDGVLWAGRGMNAALTAGAQFRWGLFSAALAPVVAWQSNSAFDARLRNDTARSEFANPWWDGIDAPQRFGAGTFSTVDPGQSFARIDVRGFAAGLSSENIRWGPVRRNPLLLSGTAPGFAHIFLETSRPVDVWIADLEFQLFWGRLDESDYFDNDPENDERVLAGLLLALQPRLLDGLTVGGGRLQSLTWWPELTLSDALLRPYRGLSQNPRGRGGDNQLITMFFHWATAPAGLEAYGEWAREDHWGTWDQLLRNLDSSQAWSLGVQKLIRRGDQALRLSAEVTHLADALPSRFSARLGPIAFYTHTPVTQGHTHRGQLLGAPIGTGAESLFLGGDYFWHAGRTSLSLERARYEDDLYSIRYAPEFRAHARDVELSVRAGHLAAFGALSFDAEVGWSMRYNRSFLGLDTIQPGDEYRRDDNWSLRTRVRWTPRGSSP